jgi:hypothetical protein
VGHCTPRRHPGLEKFGIQRCGALGLRGCADAVHLWFARLHYIRRLISLGYNPLYMDTDVTVQTNFYRFAPRHFPPTPSPPPPPTFPRRAWLWPSHRS